MNMAIVGEVFIRMVGLNCNESSNRAQSTVRPFKKIEPLFLLPGNLEWVGGESNSRPSFQQTACAYGLGDLLESVAV